MSELLEAVDALINRPADLPAPALRGRLRRADRLTQEQVANTLGVKRLAIVRWEAGKVEPRPPYREAYAHLLRGLAAKHPEALVDPDQADTSS
ncbi:helix-turn-helix domain-containing protein [Streptomyces sp. H39-S7]|uniref:helix-turn-helix domain-containing protein n=1 Tax=Streptomyces sp. H39-S7 TaxID=3004357 RepID=UPI0022AF2EC0|nr:helix-turn-helix domain-containing protein [Streptomyces sp. H39-S7]MCZ4125001.1 helix-turn-helix domain-containing protein [Streptomyces sp. H39-S7]